MEMNRPNAISGKDLNIFFNYYYANAADSIFESLEAQLEARGRRIEELSDALTAVYAWMVEVDESHQTEAIPYYLILDIEQALAKAAPPEVKK
jgi:hypothetical protein